MSAENGKHNKKTKYLHLGKKHIKKKMWQQKVKLTPKIT